MGAILPSLTRAAAVQAFIYSAAYAAVVAADHLTTTFVTAGGGVEANPMLRTDVGRLAEGRALFIMLALWPVMLGLIALARRRAVAGAPAARRPILDRFVGTTAAGALLLPVGFIFVKGIAALTNVFLIQTGVSAIDVARMLLRSVGLAEAPLDYFLVAILFLAVATAAARPIAAAWARLMARTQAATASASVAP